MNDFEKAANEVDKNAFNGEVEQDNAIEFIKNQKIATATFSQKSWITKMLKLAEKHPDEVEIVTKNTREEGAISSIVVHFPVKYIHVSCKTRGEMTEEQKAAATERLRIAREKRFGNRELSAEEEAELEAEIEEEIAEDDE